MCELEPSGGRVRDGCREMMQEGREIHREDPAVVQESDDKA